MRIADRIEGLLEATETDAEAKAVAVCAHALLYPRGVSIAEIADMCDVNRETLRRWVA